MKRKIDSKLPFNLRPHDPKTKSRKFDLTMDRFSQLPDEIIIYILSQLPSKEAMKSSLLSQRWRNLWPCSIDRRLVFRIDSAVENMRRFISDYCKDREHKRYSFARWVNDIVKLHRGETVDELTISYDLDSNFSDDIDSWLEFAMRKHAKRIELDLGGCHDNTYVFPGVEKLLTFNQRLGFVAFCNLKDLCLVSVFVDQKVINYLLSDCLSLERLCLCEFRTQEGVFLPLNFFGKNIKCLEILECTLQKVIVSAPNLVSLKYDGRKRDLELQSVPLLSELSIGRKYCESSLNEVPKDFRRVSRLKILKLEMSDKMVTKSMFLPLKFPEFGDLKELEITMFAHENLLSLLWPAILIKAAPSLHRVAVKLRWAVVPLEKPNSVESLHGDYRDSKTDVMRRLLERKTHAMKRDNDIRKATESSLQWLKVVELTGFKRRQTHFTLAQCLSRISLSLEKLVVNTWEDCIDFRQNNVDHKARKYAEGLVREIPTGVKLVVL